MTDTLFLDRDGVLNRKIHNGYVLSPEDIEILPGVKEFLYRAKDIFRHIIVITNQRCIGRGMISHNQMQEVNAIINRATGSYIDDFFVCPHLDEDQCHCRKPKEGLFLEALKRYPTDLENSWMIGDSETDLIPAKKLGIRTVYITDRPGRFADIQISSTLELQDVLPAMTGHCTSRPSV